METKIDKAIELFKKREYSKAIDEFSKVLETEPDNAEIYNNMALCYMNLNNYEKAEQYFLKSLDINRKIPQVYINLSD